ncbi:NB-ARC domain-containing protein [Streptomyces sp. CC224B]|uniref:ATP-binding protein n=1 Tax=Streptomyces sp. CC224B TaxID=3044571 RepID=UPI0024A86A2B|nr:NB-ARC domain-containing protein [Streptomyces sp. CC224B]
MAQARGPQAARPPGGRDSELIGRTDELAELAARLGRHRLVTLTGVGGVGKTRLARRAATELLPRFADGVWWVDLSPLQDGAMLAYAVAEALPLVDRTTRPVLEVLSEYVAGRRLLLVLDTCEHVVRDCAEAAATLLTVAPGLRVLATSRRPLGLPVEDVVPLGPLPETDAVTLLARRAAATDAGLTGADGAEVAALCRRLEGLPLAIELAAARLREMPPAELNRRLADRFAVLGETRQADYEADPPWHQALRTAIGWSHQLCTPDQRLLWARLSVFAGHFDVDAARAVCADDRLPAAEVPRLLASLAQGSILEWQPAGAGERYRMLDTIREFGAFWLRGLGEEHEVRGRHRDHYRALARTAEAAWFGPDQVAWYGRTAGDHPNFRAALEFCLVQQDGGTAQELSGTLWFVWFACGLPREGGHYLDRALALPSRGGHVRARAVWARGLLALAQGDGETAQHCAAAFRAAMAETPARDAAERAATECAAAHLEGGIHAVRGRAAEAAAVLEAAHGPPPAHGRSAPAWGLVQTARAFAYVHLGRYAQAAAVADVLGAECARRGDIWLRAWADYLRALAALGQERAEPAAAHARAAIAGKRRLRDHLGIAMALDVLACATLACGRAAQAAHCLGVADQLWETIGTARLGSPDLLAARRACEDSIRRRLGDDASARALRTGHTTDVDTALTALLTPGGTGG